ncbi:MAG: phosphate permease [Bacteroidetes bacterium HGW-Bacteroidetes-21]|jgi:phosphate/sulfate permease|nr:MAG: phosphate permease [Bacteroidetes bacterium HGW-Bacteroidetes-21]
MDYLYIGIVVLLFLLTISSLVVGVSNDAVNFLNSAIGSRAASFRTIMIIAGVGILIGALFSSGMMEVARKGLFHPNMFVFSEVMIIFLAVMMTNILLLDFFNTFGMPTSTTVSLVFGILGAAVSMSFIKIMDTGASLSTIGTYINSDKVLAIITGILLSVVLAFIFGSLIQYLTRFIFTFKYERKMKYAAGLFGGLSLVAILYFILIKGLKDSSILSKETYVFIEENTWLIMAGSFVFFSVLLQILHTFLKVNVLKIIVLSGTFALAMAFAGNDLVNFIGVPVAGYKSFQIYMAQSPHILPEALNMSPLLEPVKTDIFILIIAGLIMVATLWLSKKARTVIETSLQLSKQDETGKEQFGSSYIARLLVQGITKMNKSVGKMVPVTMRKHMDQRFDQPDMKAGVKKSKEERMKEDKPEFDLIRAAVNTLVASALIAAGTSLKLPLSTTYVTFMVAMGTSLSDGAWGRDTAVYRVTGVLAVIAGWFVTALVAFVLAAIVLAILSYGGLIGIIVMALLIIFLMFRTNSLHKSRETDKKTEKAMASDYGASSVNELITKMATTSTELLDETEKIYSQTFEYLFDEDRKALKKLSKDVNHLNKKAKRLKENAYSTAAELTEDMMAAGDMNILVYENLREITYCLNYITHPAYIHVNNVHRPVPDQQKQETLEILDIFQKVIRKLKAGLFTKGFNYSMYDEEISNLTEKIEQFRKDQVKRMKKDTQNHRTNLLYLGILHETNNMLIHMNNLAETCKKLQDECS